MNFSPNSVWNPRTNTGAVSTDQNLNASVKIAGYNVRVEGFDFQGSERPKRNMMPSTYDYTYSGAGTFSNESGFIRINHTGHNAEAGQFINLNYPVTGSSKVTQTDSSGFKTNFVFSTPYLYTHTELAYQLGDYVPDEGQVIIGVNSRTSDDRNRHRIHKQRIVKDDNVTSMMRSGYTHYSSISGYWYNPFISGAIAYPTYSITRIVEDFDTEVYVTGGGYSINGHYSYSDGRTKNRRLNNATGNYKTSTGYKGKGQF